MSSSDHLSSQQIHTLFSRCSPSIYKSKITTLDSKSEYPSNLSLSCSRFYFIIQGELKLKIDKQSYHMKEGYQYLIPAFVPAKWETFRYCKLFWIHFDLKFLGNLDIFKYLKITHEQEIETVSDINCLLENFSNIEEQQSIKKIIKAHSLLFQLLIPHLDDSTYKSDLTYFNLTRLSPALEYIQSRVHQSPRLEEIAEKVHLTAPYFSKFFKTTLGLSPKQYINQYRLEKAQHYLQHTQLNIQEITTKLGYYDSFHFSKAFKKYSGHSPLKYRQIQKSLL